MKDEIRFAKILNGSVRTCPQPIVKEIREAFPLSPIKDTKFAIILPTYSF